MKRLCVAIALAYLCVVNAVKAQVATVVEDATEVEYLSPTNCVTHHRTTVLVDNQRGLTFADFFCPCDKNSELSSFSGEIKYIKSGASKKIKKNELHRSEYSSNLATDSYYFFYSPTPASYPFCVTYEWTTKDTGAILSLDSFSPQPGCDVNVVKASYTATYSSDVQIHYTLSNIESEVKTETLADGKNRLTLVLKDIPALKSEKFMPSLSTLLPKAYFVPETFVFDKTNGTLSTWQSFGKWLRTLQEGRDVLSDDLKQKLHLLTDGYPDSYQKLLLVYRLLEESTRYVSIQLGIGGLQPAPASEVFKHGFGDCKGLSNLTVAMLKEVGIDADYVVIGTKHENLPTDFANMSMLNHAIVRVNMPEGEVWLECTNPEYPLGYVHQDIANHEAIIVTDSGGEKARLPKYAAEQNTDSVSVKIVLGADGSASIRTEEQAKNACYESWVPMLHIDADKQRERLRDRLALPNFVFDSHSIAQQLCQDRIKNECLPIINTHFDGNCRKYANITGTRMFANLYPFSSGSKVNATDVRINPVQITDYDRCRIIHIEMLLPDGYGIEFMPPAVNEENVFGNVVSEIKSESNAIIADIRLSYNANTYSADKYPEACSFVNRISELLSSKVVLKKE